MLFVIPARGGSQGVTRKNLREVAGIPLVGWAIRQSVRAAKRLGSGHRVVCSTEDAEIARVAREWGAEVPFERPLELASATASSEAVMLHALDWFEAAGETFAAIARVQPTTPLTSAADIAAAIRLFLGGDGTPVTTVSPARPPSWTYVLESGRLREVVPEPPGVVRRQDLPDYYALTGAVSVNSPSRLRATGQIIEPGSRALVTPADRSVDIDTEDDLRLAEALLAARSAGSIHVGQRRIGAGQPAYVIAEAGVNHNGDPVLARRLVDAAHASGADAVKFQTWKTEKLLTPEAPLADYQKKNLGTGTSQFAMIQALELPAESLSSIAQQARKLGITFLSTPDEEDSADLLESLGVPAFKIGSAEVSNLDFLRHLALKNRPLILSTGMATLLEVERAVLCIEAAGDPPLALLHCVSDYPSAPADTNLRAIDTLRGAFGRAVGLSDHTEGHTIALAAVARGACVIEKHLTLERSLPGPDHRASLDPAGFTALVRAIRDAESAMGDGQKRPTAAELVHRSVMRKRCVAARALPAGARLTRADIALRRADPAGFDPADLDSLVGRTLLRAVAAWDTLVPELLA